MGCMANIISSFDKFSKEIDGVDLSKDAARMNALKHYFSRGWVVSIAENEGSWPRLLYPSILRLQQQIASLGELRNNYASKQRDWKQKFFQASIYHVVNNMKKFKESLYWKHLAKYATDSTYRSNADSIKLPIHLVADKKWQPMIKMFVNDAEYRHQLTETVQNSIVYKNDKRVAKFADTLKDFRMQESSKKVESLQKKIDDLDRDISALQEMMKWAKS